MQKPPAVLSAKDGVDPASSRLSSTDEILPRPFLKKRPVEGNDLRRVRDRVFRQARHRGGQQHVSRRARPP